MFQNCMALQIIIVYFEFNILFSGSQFGFREGRNTILGILALIFQVLEESFLGSYFALVHTILSNVILV